MPRRKKQIRKLRRRLRRLRKTIKSNPAGDGIHYVGDKHAFTCQDGMTFSSDSIPHLVCSDTASQSAATKTSPTKIKGFYVNSASAYLQNNPTSQTTFRVRIYDSSNNLKFDEVVDCSGTDWVNHKGDKRGNWKYIKTGKIKKAQRVVVPGSDGPNPLAHGFRPSLRWLSPWGYDPLG